MTYWISQPEHQIFLVGMVLMLLGAFVLLWLAFPTSPKPEPVETYEWHTAPLPPRALVTHSEFKYTVMDEWYPFKDETVEFVAAVDSCAEATTEATTEVIEAVDPLTVELPVYDDDTPLYWSIPAPKRPKQFELETFTQGINRAQLERAMAARRPE